MTYRYILLLLIGFAMLPLEADAQHGHQSHANSNALKSGEVNKEHSLHHMQAKWISHRNETVRLSDFAGKPVIIVMYYGNCTQVCPILIRDANRVYEAVDETLRKNVRVLAVTFDPVNDTPEKLNKYAAKKNLDLPEWHFMTGSKTDIRELAMLTGVEYSRKSDGHFAHSNLVTVLDGSGKIMSSLEGLNQPVQEAANRINNYLRNTKKEINTHKH